MRSDSSVADLHHILQIVMGWDNTHVHRFTLHGKEYGIAQPGGFQRQVPDSHNASGPVGANAPGPATAPSCPGGSSARKAMAPPVLLKAEWGQGLWERVPDALTQPPQLLMLLWDIMSQMPGIVQDNSSQEKQNTRPITTASTKGRYGRVGGHLSFPTRPGGDPDGCEHARTQWH